MYCAVTSGEIRNDLSNPKDKSTLAPMCNFQLSLFNS